VRALRRALLFVGLVGWGLIGAAEPLVLDIADFNQDITIFGANAKDFLTDFNSIAIGDVNGDGFADLILGDPPLMSRKETVVTPAKST
jgi:hypothetical protein